MFLAISLEQPYNALLFTGAWACANGWVKYGNRCFYFSGLETVKSFSAGERKCKSRHSSAHLASIHSSQENNFIYGNQFNWKIIMIVDMSMYIFLFTYKLSNIFPKPSSQYCFYIRKKPENRKRNLYWCIRFGKRRTLGVVWWYSVELC